MQPLPVWPKGVEKDSNPTLLLLHCLHLPARRCQKISCVFSCFTQVTCLVVTKNRTSNKCLLPARKTRFGRCISDVTFLWIIVLKCVKSRCLVRKEHLFKWNCGRFFLKDLPCCHKFFFFCVKLELCFAALV